MAGASPSLATGRGSCPEGGPVKQETPRFVDGVLIAVVLVLAVVTAVVMLAMTRAR